MFTLEESAHLGFMLRVAGLAVAVVFAAVLCYAGVHWAHAHHHLPSLHLFHLTRHA